MAKITKHNASTENFKFLFFFDKNKAANIEAIQNLTGQKKVAQLTPITSLPAWANRAEVKAFAVNFLANGRGLSIVRAPKGKYLISFIVKGHCEATLLAINVDRSKSFNCVATAEQLGKFNKLLAARERIAVGKFNLGSVTDQLDYGAKLLGAADKKRLAAARSAIADLADEIDAVVDGFVPDLRKLLGERWL